MHLTDSIKIMPCNLFCKQNGIQTEIFCVILSLGRWRESDSKRRLEQNASYRVNETEILLKSQREEKKRLRWGGTGVKEKSENGGKGGGGLSKRWSIGKRQDGECMSRIMSVQNVMCAEIELSMGQFSVSLNYDNVINLPFIIGCVCVCVHVPPVTYARRRACARACVCALRCTCVYVWGRVSLIRNEFCKINKEQREIKVNCKQI